MGNMHYPHMLARNGIIRGMRSHKSDDANVLEGRARETKANAI